MFILCLSNNKILLLILYSLEAQFHYIDIKYRIYIIQSLKFKVTYKNFHNYYDIKSGILGCVLQRNKKAF